MRFPDYRRFEENRIDVNNAMMALLAGSRIANHAIENAGAPSGRLEQVVAWAHANMAVIWRRFDSRALDTREKLLGEIFPAVEHIERFNLRTGPAKKYLSAADDHLASMAITYALAIHEDFITSMVEFARTSGIAMPSSNSFSAKTMHGVLFQRLGHQASQEWLECFQLLRCMRNSVVHAGRRVQQELVDQINNMSPGAAQEWQQLNNQPPSDVIQNGQIILISSHIFSALAVIKRLAREANAALVSAVPAGIWAEICVQDYQSFTTKTKNSVPWRRALIGYARSRYGPLQLSEGDLEVAARSLGAWTLSSWP